MKFESTSFDGNTLDGNLRIKDVVKPISLDIDFNSVAFDPYGQTKAGYEITRTINRKDFELTWNAVTEAGSIVVSINIKLLIDFSL